MEDKSSTCKCPYCDGEIECADLPVVCGPCSITIITCESCGGKAREGTENCPECGKKL